MEAWVTFEENFFQLFLSLSHTELTLTLDLQLTSKITLKMETINHIDQLFIDICIEKIIGEEIDPWQM